MPRRKEIWYGRVVGYVRPEQRNIVLPVELQLDASREVRVTIPRHALDRIIRAMQKAGKAIDDAEGATLSE